MPKHLKTATSGTMTGSPARSGGYAASLQALAHGIPLVIAGQSDDKAEVAARLAWTGAALKLTTDTPAEADILTAVNTVTSNPAYREHARRLQADIQQHSPFDEIARAITEVSSKHGPH